MKLPTPRRDLDIAASEIEKMKITTSFQEFEESWQNFLIRIERAWESTERVIRKEKGFEQWHKPYTTLRKKDSLLVFLKQARNSEMHGISASVSKPLEMVIEDKTGRGMAIKSISSELEGGSLTININTQDIFSDVSVNLVPTDPELIKIKNRGKWYKPPWWHLKVRIEDVHPVAIAELGHNFYSSYVSGVEYWLSNKN